jgi:glycosyltransferase involved in cell wall biosynthesis
MRASIVITTRDRWDTLERTLRSVVAQALSRSEFEVLVIDDASRTPPSSMIAAAARRGAVLLLGGAGPRRGA